MAKILKPEKLAEIFKPEMKPTELGGKTLPAEMWDKMQYLFRNYYDRMVHFVMFYDAPVDVEAMKTVLIWTTEKEPVLHSSFHGNAIDPYWSVEEYTIDDILTVKTDCRDLTYETDKFLTQEIPTDSNVQFKSAILSDGEKWAFAMIVNHMCMDGGDFKYFTKKIAENYNKKLRGERGFEIKTGSRSYDAVYSKLTDEELKVAKGLYKNISAVKDDHKFPLTPPCDNDRSIINRRKIPAETFETFRKIGKKMDVTVNDLMLAFYVHSLYEIGMFKENESLAIPCMVDLRRHIVDGAANTGLTNHTGFMVIKVDGKGATVNDTLINVLNSVRESKNDPYMGMYSLPLLKLAYAIFPYIISETAIKIGYLNPLIGMSNIGLIDVDALKLGDAEVVDGFMTGAVKFKPYMQLALTTLKGEITMSIAIKGNDEDIAVVNRFFDILLKNTDNFIADNMNRLE